VNTASDPNNCGMCGLMCPTLPGATPPACVGGACAQTGCVDPATSLCLNGCFDLTADPNNCGACGNVCPANSGATGVCTAGVCM
jgi:hypothetical protein